MSSEYGKNLILFTCEECKTKENKQEERITRSNAGKEDSYHLGSVRVRSALRSTEAMPAIRTSTIDEVSNKRDLSMITAAPGNNRQRIVQDCETFKDRQEKLETRYAGKSMVKKLDTFGKLLNR